MKKTYFAAIAVLLAVLIAGCDGFIEPTKAARGNEEGLKISFQTTDGSRALTTPIAAAGADFFEVIFDNSSRKVRTSWGNGATGRIIPGDGDYDNSGTDKAYIFAGRNGTLLGVGVLVQVMNGSTPAVPATLIEMDKATEVIFEITAFNTDVGGLLNPAGVAPVNAVDGSNPAASTFTIELEPLQAFSGNMVGPLLLDASQDPPLTAPVFVVNPGATNTVKLAATFDITDTTGKSLSDTDYDDIRSAIITTSTSNAAFPTPDPSDLNRVNCTGYLWEAGNSPFAKVTGVTKSITAGNEIPIPIAMDIYPGTKAGLSQVSIEIPVVLYDNVAADNGAKPVTWYIRGGLNNTLADQGAAFNDGDGSLGGAIIIGVGEYNKNAAGLIISWNPIQ